MSKKNLTILLYESPVITRDEGNVEFNKRIGIDPFKNQEKARKFKIRYRPGKKPVHPERLAPKSTYPQSDLLHPAGTAASFAEGISDKTIEIDFISVPFLPSRAFTKQRDDLKKVYKNFPASVHLKSNIEHYKPDIVLMSANINETLADKDLTSLKDAFESVAYVTNTPIIQAAPNNSVISKTRNKRGNFTPNSESPYLLVANPKQSNQSPSHSGFFQTMLQPDFRVDVRFPEKKNERGSIPVWSGNSFAAPFWAATTWSLIAKKSKMYSQKVGASLATKALFINYIKNIKSSPAVRDKKGMAQSLENLEQQLFDSYNKLAEERGRQVKRLDIDLKDVIDSHYNTTINK